MKELKMEDIQQVSLQILKKVADVCEENGFNYILAFGTLIGVIRHNGYIPWDDDVDIIMPRPDYERLLAYMAANPIENLEVFNHNTNPKYMYGITRICDVRYRIATRNEEDCGMGIFIDIYPFDGLGNTKEGAIAIQQKFRTFTFNIINASRSFFLRPPSFNLGNLFYYYKNLLQCHIKGRDYYFDHIDNELAKLDYSNSEYVGLVSWIFNPERNLYKKEWIENTMYGVFEGLKFRIPVHYDEMLKASYGDYMKLPPVENRIYHHQYKAYKKE